MSAERLWSRQVQPFARDRKLTLREKPPEISELYLGLRKPEVPFGEEELFRRIADQLPGVLWLADPVSGNIEFVSRGFETIWGYSRDKLYADKDVWLEQVHPDEYADLRRKSRPTCDTWEARFRLCTADGAWRWIESRRRPVYDSWGKAKYLAGYATDVTRMKTLEESVEVVSKIATSARSDERRRIARELHDSAGHDLAEVSFTLSQIERLLTPDDVFTRELLTAGREKLAHCGREISDFAFLQHPPELEILGFTESVRQFVEGYGKRSKIRAQVQIGEDFPTLPNDLQVALYRILQEALQNVHKHARCRSVLVRLMRYAGCISMLVRDDGRGFNCKVAKGTFGVGLPGMRERAEKLGGRFALESNRAGTSILVTFPYPQRD